MRPTSDVLLENLLKDHEERRFEVSNGGGIRGAGQSHTQAERLKEEVVELRLRGVLDNLAKPSDQGGDQHVHRGQTAVLQATARAQKSWKMEKKNKFNEEKSGGIGVPRIM